MKITKNSLLWRLATVYGPMWDSQTNTNVCQLWRSILLGAVVCCIAVLFGTIIGTMVGSFLFWAYISLAVHPFFLPFPALLGALSAVALVAILAVHLMKQAASRKLETWEGPKEGGFVDIALHRFHDWHKKVCTPITVSEAEPEEPQGG